MIYKFYYFLQFFKEIYMLLFNKIEKNLKIISLYYYFLKIIISFK